MLRQKYFKYLVQLIASGRDGIKISLCNIIKTHTVPMAVIKFRLSLLAHTDPTRKLLTIQSTF